MTNTIENICYEYSEDVLFSQENSFDGSPVLIICHTQVKYIQELSCFLKNHGYQISSRKNTGKHFSLVRFELINLSHYDEFKENRDTDQEN